MLHCLHTRLEPQESETLIGKKHETIFFHCYGTWFKMTLNESAPILFLFTLCSTSYPKANLFRNSLFGRNKEKCASKSKLRSLLARNQPFTMFLTSFWRTSQSWSFYSMHRIKLWHREGCSGVLVLSNTPFSRRITQVLCIRNEMVNSWCS